jgi:hypothetical protein
MHTSRRTISFVAAASSLDEPARNLIAEFSCAPVGSGPLVGLGQLVKPRFLDAILLQPVLEVVAMQENAMETSWTALGT